MRSILLIDDKEADFVAPVATELRGLIDSSEVTVETWSPSRRDEDPKARFDSLLTENNVQLVITDYDLTQTGLLGFFGTTVVEWCQDKGIPVGDFSRGATDHLPAEPNLFELRVPTDSVSSASNYIYGVDRGFAEIRKYLAGGENTLTHKSPSHAIAQLLGMRGMEGQFLQYTTRYSGANSALIRILRLSGGKRAAVEKDLLAYIMGYLLLNGVLRFPGAIVNSEALAAFLAIARTESVAIEPTFGAARYTGPFSQLGPFFWTHLVEEALSSHEGDLAGETFETVGARNRSLAEKAAGHVLDKDKACPRCSGENGGFLCPFTKRTVCERPDCSTVSNTWIPVGARLSRIEKVFYEEWAPILRM